MTIICFSITFLREKSNWDDGKTEMCFFGKLHNKKILLHCKNDQKQTDIMHVVLQ